MVEFIVGLFVGMFLASIMFLFVNDTDSDEILLHRSGHAYGNTLYLRTVMRSNSTLKLQIAANTNIGKAYTYTFKFKRIL